MSDQHHDNSGADQQQHPEQQYYEGDGADGGPIDDVEDDFDSEDEWAAPPADRAEGAASQDGAAGGSHDATGKPHGVAREIDYAAMGEEEAALAGASVRIVFTGMPGFDDRPPAHTFVMGQTVAHIKALLEDCYGVPYHVITLKLKGMVLLDPLSLNDLPFDAAVDNVVQVTLS
jgi:hypothetical protein